MPVRADAVCSAGSVLCGGGVLAAGGHEVGAPRGAGHGMTFWEYIRRGMDPTTVAVMMEDGAAVTGLLIASGLPELASVFTA